MSNQMINKSWEEYKKDHSKEDIAEMLKIQKNLISMYVYA